MTDMIDYANEHADYLLDIALKNRQAVATHPSALFCEDCGAPIPEQRRELVKGCVTCVDCQEIREARP